MPEPRKIGLLGGTFDPVHRGHVHVAEVAAKSLALDEIRFLPCRISPHKTATTPAPARDTDRLEMLRLATASLPWAVVDDCEVRRIGPSFSYQTAAAMAARFPTARLFWIMGCDQWEALPRWEKPQRLAALVEFIVITRGNHPQPRDGYVLHPVNDDHPASASVIRAAIACGVTTHPWLTPTVAKYITERRLYHGSS